MSTTGRLTAPPDSAPDGQHRPLLSLLALGGGLLIFVSYAIPYFEPPFGGYLYMQWLSGGTTVLGVMAARRRESGPMAQAGLASTALAGFIFLSTILVPLAYGVAMDVFMPN
jgi:hypothetical protein